MPFVLKRTDQWGGYVAASGSRSAYTTLKHARRFPTRDAAQAERCPDNEVILEVP